MNDWQSNYSPSLSSTFGPWYSNTTKSKIVKAQHAQTLTLEPLKQISHKKIQSRISVSKRRVIPVQFKSQTTSTMETTTIEQKQRTLPDPIIMNMTKEPLYVRKIAILSIQ